MTFQAEFEIPAEAENPLGGAPTEAGADRIERLLSGLNPPQRKAAEHTEGPLLVVAGAGSGKTRVLTHRIAYLLATGAARPGEILAITFTNKAAAEMRERVGELVGRSVRAMWVTTFHSSCARMLRADAERLGYSRSFTIYDQSDSLRMLKRVMRELGVDPKRYPARAIQNKISGAKNQLIDSDMYAETIGSVFEEAVAECFPLYEKRMLEANAMDFDDLLVRTVNALELFEEVRERWRRTFRHVLVDEYQDTNHAQYRLLQLLASEHGNLMVVGDEDQCLVEGTPVTMGDGSTKPIEQISKGDMVMSCHGSADFRPARVTGTFKAWEKEGVEIRTLGGRRLVSTPEHTHFAGYRLGTAPQMNLTYLMWKRGVGFRVGTTGVYSERGRSAVGIRQRCLQEHADAAWVISAHESDAEARAAEVKLSLRYGLPMLPFYRRKSVTGNSLVGNQALIDDVFSTLDTEAGGYRLLDDEGLSLQHPHHLAATSDGRRRVLRVTLCADQRGSTPMHRIALAGRDPAGKQALESIGLSVRPAKAKSDSWRFETVLQDFGEAVRIAGDISRVLDVDVGFFGRFGETQSGRISGSSLPCLPAASVRPGMTVFTGNGEYDAVESVERITLDRPVYDINVEGTHNFVAGDLVTHNSIYGFRHADIRNILDFEQDFPEAEVVKLEQNYRSTQTILSAANAVVERNRERRPKELWTDIEGGELVQLSELGDEHEEARWVAAEIERLGEEHGVKRADVAVFYRTNAMSRVLEDTLVRYEVPYQVIGGTKFYDRAEVKDAVAYLSLLLNPADQVSFLRVVNSPRRGIGNTTQGRLAAYANTAGLTIWEVAERAEEVPGLSAAAVKAVSRFFETMDLLKARVASGATVADVVQAVLSETGYVEALEAERTVEAEGRIENLDAFTEAAAEFDLNREQEGESEVPPLEEFLQQISLLSDQDSIEEEQDLVTLMTVHNAKGLEYDTVFVIGCEDGTFPHMMALEEGGEEEERRLCYVAITRARQRLYMTWTRERRLFGRSEHNLPSRFIDELPVELTERHATVSSTVGGMTWEPTPGADPAQPVDPGPAMEMQAGDDVVHASFGDGIVTGVEPGGVVIVRFSSDGSERKLMADYAPIREALAVAARTIDGKAVAATVRERVRLDVAAYVEESGRAPTLATVIVGDDPASEIYVRNKHKACEEAGMLSVHHGLAAATSEDELLELVAALGADDDVDGILVQLPVPDQIDPDAVVAAIDPGKDVDGLTPVNAGLLAHGVPNLVPCTPAGVMGLLAHEGVELEGAEAVVVGRSKLVGVPVARLLLAANATVTVCHSRTRDLAATCRRADVLVAAVGVPGLLGADAIKPGAVVIDVGVNRTEDGLRGDVDFAAAAEIAVAITPVPGGVGPMTIAMLLVNTLQAARLRTLSSPA